VAEGRKQRAAGLAIIARIIADIARDPKKENPRSKILFNSPPNVVGQKALF